MTKVTPTCRYGHGELFQVTNRGEIPEWSLLSGKSINVGFLVTMFECKECGYIELFDKDFELTFKEESTE